MITETETAFLAVVRAFLTEEKAALEELAALTEKQWNHLFASAKTPSPQRLAGARRCGPFFRIARR